MKIPNFDTQEELTDWVGWHIDADLKRQILEFIEDAETEAYLSGLFDGRVAVCGCFS